MSEQDLLLIEQYYRNALSDAERLAFEQRLTEDTPFREEAMLHQRALNAIHQYGKEQLKKKLQERPLIAPDSTMRVWRWEIAALVLLACFVLGYWWMQSHSRQDLPLKSILPSPVDTIIQKAPPSNLPNNQTPPPIDQRSTKQKPDPKRLFASVFQPYQEAIKSTSRTGAQNNDTSKLTLGLRQLKQLALDKKYAESLTVVEQLPPGIQQEASISFFKANSLMALDRTDEAVVLFEIIASNRQTAYASHAQWYAALCALKKGDLMKAKKWLGVLAANENAATTQRSEAKKLLEQLQ